VLLAGSLLFAMSGGVSAENDDAVAQAGAWEKAAGVREETAGNHQSLAQELLAEAAEWRTSDYLYDSERKSNFEKAGDCERKAGDLEQAASTSFLKAAENWETAAGFYDDDSKKARNNALAMAAAAKESARAALEAAIPDYMLAADAFSADNADCPEKLAAANAKADAAREKLKQLTPAETDGATE
jgi:hypothetical protein